MVILSSLPKLDVFQIAEGLNQRGMLAHLYTGFASEKNRLINHFVSRKDNEVIPVSLITDFWMVPLLQHYHKSSIYNEAFDRLVASKIRAKTNYKAILAWSGMAEHSLRSAKRLNKLTVVGRESCHIKVQNRILSEEYIKYGLSYKVDTRITEKELREYDAADKIYVCSSFVKKTFLENGIPEEKLFLNPIAVPNLFKPATVERTASRFTILFLGKLTIRKGLRYLFEALEKINMRETDFQAWFVGAADPIIRREFESRKRPNWKYIGFVPQTMLPEIISQADVGIFPSLEDGFAQVVPQQLSCGIPVITTGTTGSSDFIKNGHNGFVVNPYDSDCIAERIEQVFGDSDLLRSMKGNALTHKLDQLSPQVVSSKFAEFFNRTL